MSLYDIIDRSEQAKVRTAYKLKSYRERLARYSNHLTFLIRCKTHGIIPKGLWVTLPVRSTKAEHITERTSQALVRERIGEAYRQKVILDANQWARVDDLCKDAAKCVHKDTKERQIRKFRTLKSQGTQTQAMLDRSKLVINLSHRQLTSVEEEVLALGLSFAMAPRSIPLEDIIAATEATAHTLDRNTAVTLRTSIAEALRRTKPPKPNMSYRQRSAVHALRDDPNIVIVPADKGKATVVMDRQDYDTKMKAVLQDGKYQTLRRDPTVKVENRIASTLKSLRNNGHIDDKLCDYLMPRYTTSPQMYGLPKIHKEDIPMRPIVSTINSPSYKVAKELTRILTPLAAHTVYTVKNSTAFVDRVRGMEITPQDRLVSFDVKNLFTQVPVEEALKVVE